MPCPSSQVLSDKSAQVSDLLFVHPFTAAEVFRPLDKGELVRAVANGTQAGGSVRALGSNWSLSEAGKASNVIDTSALNRHLSQPVPTPMSALPTGRLRGTGGAFLTSACARDPQRLGRHFVHVEAGIKLKDLLADLASFGLALPTMGDGAGQSLIGALSTATHGGDFLVPPLVDWLRAVHLIGPKGQEFWITPKGSPFGFEPLVPHQPAWCSDTRFLASDDAFDAVRVGVGRMGVVYAVVLEVVPQYTLMETNLEYRWPEVRAMLKTAGPPGTGAPGILNQPLGDLESGWFRDEVLRRTVYPNPNMSSNPGFEYRPGEGWPNVPQYFDRHPEVIVKLIKDMGLSDLSADLRSRPPIPLHHLNIAISLSTPARCWIRRRWKRTEPFRGIAIASPTTDPLVIAVKANRTNPPAVVDALKDRLELDPVTNFLGWLTHDPRKQRLDWYLDSELSNIANQHKALGYTSGEFLLLALHRIGTDSVLKVTGEIAMAASNVIGGAFAKLMRVGPASGSLNANMLDAHDYEVDGAQAGSSAEFHFDAQSGLHMDFIDAVANIAIKHIPVFGYIGLRFTPASSGLIAMQQYQLTASVEVSTLRSRVDDVFAGFWNDVHTAASVIGGIPHWGQEIRQSAAELAGRYGVRMAKWRNALAELAVDGPTIFSTDFSRDKGLEPGVQDDNDDDAVAVFFIGLGAGMDA